MHFDRLGNQAVLESIHATNKDDKVYITVQSWDDYTNVKCPTEVQFGFAIAAVLLIGWTLNRIRTRRDQNCR